MRALEFITGHVIYNPAYTYKFQLKTTQENEESLHSAAASLERGRIKLMDSMDVASPRPSESENPNYNGWDFIHS